MALPTLNARYSISVLAGYFLLTFGFWSVCYYIYRKAGLVEFPLLSSPFLFLSVLYLYQLLTAKRIVMSIDETGFKDRRLSATVIPWSAVKSMQPLLSSKWKNEIGVIVEITPKSWQTLPIRRSFKFWKAVGYMGLDGETSASLNTDCLDTGWSEVLRVAGAYTLIKTRDWSIGVE
jgi:hypothetical protein